MILNLNLSVKHDQTTEQSKNSGDAFLDQTMVSDESRGAVSLLSSDFHWQQTLLTDLNSVAVCRSQEVVYACFYNHHT